MAEPEGVWRVEVAPDLTISRGVEAYDPKAQKFIFVGASDGPFIEIAGRDDRLLMPLEMAGRLASMMPMLMLVAEGPTETHDAALRELGLEPAPR